MIVLGIDAGVHLGVALLEVHWRVGSFEPLELATLHGGLLDAKARIHELAIGAELVVVEVPVGANYSGRPNTAALVNAASIGSHLAGFVDGIGKRVMTCSAAEWRRALGCSGTRSETADRAVSRVLRLRCCGEMPRCSNHARDAAGAGIYAALRVMRDSTIAKAGVRPID